MYPGDQEVLDAYKWFNPREGTEHQGKQDNKYKHKHNCPNPHFVPAP